MLSCVSVLQIARNRETLGFFWVVCIYCTDTRAVTPQDLLSHIPQIMGALFRIKQLVWYQGLSAVLLIQCFLISAVFFLTLLLLPALHSPWPFLSD